MGKQMRKVSRETMAFDRPKSPGRSSPQKLANRMERRDKSCGDRPKSEPQTRYGFKLAEVAELSRPLSEGEKRWTYEPTGDRVGLNGEE